MEMTRLLNTLDSGSKLAKGFGRIYLLVPEMQRLSRVTTVANQDEAERLTREVEVLEQYVLGQVVFGCFNLILLTNNTCSRRGRWRPGSASS
jgi:hypothetical protein